MNDCQWLLHLLFQKITVWKWKKTRHFPAPLTFLRLTPVFLTCHFTNPPIGFQNVSFITVTSKRSSLIVTVLTTKAWRVTFINIFTGLRIICELVSNRTSTLSSKRSLNTFMSAACIIIRAALLIWNGVGKGNKHIVNKSSLCWIYYFAVALYQPEIAVKTCCTIISYACETRLRLLCKIQHTQCIWRQITQHLPLSPRIHLQQCFQKYLDYTKYLLYNSSTKILLIHKNLKSRIIIPGWGSSENVQWLKKERKEGREERKRLRLNQIIINTNTNSYK